jgi:glucose-1-phosphate cytidylyltransferase
MARGSKYFVESMRVMKVIILAGGLGSRISEETTSKPKPMVFINGEPILSHIFRIYAMQGITEFILALGYKGEVILDWIKSQSEGKSGNNYLISLNLTTPPKSTEIVQISVEAVDTGLDTQTGGRILKCMNRYPDQTMFATYGDGLANVSISKLLSFHQSAQKLCTVTAVRPAARFGFLEIQDGVVSHFGEKDQADSGWINGGFFVLDPRVSNYIEDYDEPFETGALPRLVTENQLAAYQHFGFFKPMDTLREKNELEEMAKRNTPPWSEIV